MYNKNVSEKVQAVSNAIEEAENEDQIFDIVTSFYKAYGVGMFGLNKAFRITREHGDLEFVPINNTEDVMLDDLIGYEIQKKKIVDNTEAFVEGRKRTMHFSLVTVEQESQPRSRRSSTSTMTEDFV